MKDYIAPMVGGFAGAFFAYLFMRISDIGKSIVNRQSKHLRALGNLEILFGDLATAISSNQYELEQFLKAFELLQETNEMISTPNRPQPLDFRDEAFSGLGNSDLLNEIMSYRASVRSMNGDITALWNMHEKLRDLTLSNPAHLPNYMDNFKLCAEGARVLTAAHDQLNDRTMRIQAIIRILYRRDKTLFHRLSASSIASHYPKSLNRDVDIELKKLSEEIERSLEESKKRIREIFREPEKPEYSGSGLDKETPCDKSTSTKKPGQG